ncbi:ATP/GTP-binding protein [Streptomyces melanogenes]|uniref:ATP/GTP-binding protein n=1 Tax=Streptomyces melanogenes TaxID=67326 RepID=A0ABZ1XQ40_9ACTN|nr:ATP/GTP-binding protein [Streptomyces melanogenes]
MDTEGTHDARGTEARPVPRPAAPPPVPAPPPAFPPQPARPPGRPPLGEWLRTPRAAAEPGLWRYGHRPRPTDAVHRVPDRALLSGAVIALLAAVLVWSLWRNGYVPHRMVPLELFTPSDWWGFHRRPPAALTALAAYNSLVAVAVIYVFGHFGNWREVFRRYAVDHPQPARAVRTALVAIALAWFVIWADDWLPFYSLAFGVVPHSWIFSDDPVATKDATDTVTTVYHVVVVVAALWVCGRAGDWLGLFRERTGRAPGARTPAPAGAPADRTPADWPQLREAGQHAAADRLAADAESGRMNDVDCARIRRAWTSVVADPARLPAFTDAVLRDGARACLHPSGDRDLPARAATHDLLTSQVRLGRFADLDTNPPARRGAGAAVDPAALGTSLLALGPSGAGKTRRLVRPVVESLALQALAGQAAVVAVGAAGTPLGADEAYDVIVRPGDPASEYDLDLYGGTVDPDEAAALLAEACAGDLPDADVRRAATALAQLLGPYRAAYGRFPSVPRLRELLDGSGDALDELRAELDREAHPALHRELDARVRQAGVPGDPGLVLADRLACLDRPAFAAFFDTTGHSRPFSLRALEHPVRVRVDLPERAHPEAARLLNRLLLAQFTTNAVARHDRSLFACLVLDDATHAVTSGSVRALQRLRQANAGVVLTLRALGDVPERLHTSLLAAVGCHMAFCGVTTWDGQLLAQLWGTEWIETTEVAKHAVFADQPLTRALHALRKLATGKPVTRDAVTVRKVERERWSASQLAHQVPAGHAVLSLTDVGGEHAPPLLVDLRG